MMVVVVMMVPVVVLPSTHTFVMLLAFILEVVGVVALLRKHGKRTLSNVCSRRPKTRVATHSGRLRHIVTPGAAGVSA